MKVIKKGEAHFRETYSHTKTCATCGYFAPHEGKRHMGLCEMHVPEADFTKNNPERVTCDYWAKEKSKGWSA